MNEIGAKLDLARTHIDNGDPEGARRILDEISSEGDLEKREAAQKLIASLA